MEKLGEVSGFQMTSVGVVSPDGASVASKLNQANIPFIVVSCKDNAKAFEMDVPERERKLERERKQRNKRTRSQTSSKPMHRVTLHAPHTRLNNPSA